MLYQASGYLGFCLTALRSSLTALLYFLARK